MRVNKYFATLLLIFCLALLSVSIPAQDYDDYPPLPNDLIFTSSYSIENADGTVSRIHTLVLLDGETMEYTVLEGLRDDRGIRPISWSPQGDKLAGLGFVAPTDVPGITEIEVCVITIADVEEVCMDETTELYYTAGSDIIWSDDGWKIYFTTWKQGILRLLEADATTGETLRVIYETDYWRDEWREGLTVGLSPNRRHIAVGVGYDHIPPGILVDLETYQVIDLSELLRPYLDQAAEEFVSVRGYICGGFTTYPVFSPSGTYLVGYISIPHDEEDYAGGRYVIFDTEGNVVKTFDIYADYPACPVWSEDESRLYILAFDWQRPEGLIYQYSFEDDQFAQYSPTDLEIDTVISPSPDETHMVFPGYFLSGYAVYVLYPDGVIRRFCEDGHSCDWPLWRPNSE